MIQQTDLVVNSLGPADERSPLEFESPRHDGKAHFVSDEMRVRFNVETGPAPKPTDDLFFEEAGPREQIYFQPANTTAAIVTCGGLSPGLNNVIRSTFYELTENYGVPRVLGIRNGYLGLTADSGREPITLTREFVEPIDKLGGTFLGSSRGPQDSKDIADFLRKHEINILFCLGGDGTQHGAQAICEEIQEQGMDTAVVGIPKTIDNDIPFVRQSFGYATALEKAAEVIRGAHVEARGAINGVGLVKLMGRQAGFIAAGATVVSQEVNFTLVPEIPFPLEGKQGLLDALLQRVQKRGHAVVVVAEGAGQYLFEQQEDRHDASGNVQRHDIGIFLRQKFIDHFRGQGVPIALKYLDPSYHIRSVPANAYDRFLCDQMARHAVHAGMAGKTGVMIGFEHGQFINVPIPAVVDHEKRIDVTGDLWRAVLQVTRQPRW